MPKLLKEYSREGKIIYASKERSKNLGKVFKAKIEISCDGELYVSNSSSASLDIKPVSKPITIVKPIRLEWNEDSQKNIINDYEMSTKVSKKNILTTIKQDFYEKYNFYHYPDESMEKMILCQNNKLLREYVDSVKSLSILKDDINKYQQIVSIAISSMGKNNDYPHYPVMKLLGRLKRIEEKNPGLFNQFMDNVVLGENREPLKRILSTRNFNDIKENGIKNEIGFRKIFDKYAYLYGYRILHYATACPDYILEKDEKEIRAEAESYSSNFISHKHDPKVCDMIVCWMNDLSEGEIRNLNLDIWDFSGQKILHPDGSSSNLEHLLKEKT